MKDYGQDEGRWVSECGDPECECADRNRAPIQDEPEERDWFILLLPVLAFALLPVLAFAVALAFFVGYYWR